ncbi:molybdenum cofactor biosynthesis protein MoaE [Pedobacter psychroterrae]|uniref:Molybdopterin synthase catalytic subunit n=1 Tax=Pedobacter psychroterrae TaxID=2530453 RepID=A0A4R0NSX9_9SPHI|nr:molybdenum cofactor biosynthesis protein MoaE [Pedobacter psychroterrae]TCD02525.1 molybdenum cofactor biosynthesis protein MoaE [Pedobacter psychroterrae]
MESKKKVKNIFIQGAISPGFITDCIAKHSSNTAIGGHSIFMGQVRQDEIGGKLVSAIAYSAFEELALEKMHEIREAIFEKYPLSCMHVHHSLGDVSAGEICLFVFTSSAHRKPAIEACSELVERIKAELPIWGKEIFQDNTHHWKENK